MLRVLIQEPDPSVRQLLELEVEHLGYEVAEEAGPFDIALIEPADPEGYELAERLYTLEPRVPVVFVSVRSRTADFAAVRPYAHLLKPFSLRALGSALMGASEMLPGKAR